MKSNKKILIKVLFAVCVLAVTTCLLTFVMAKSSTNTEAKVTEPAIELLDEPVLYRNLIYYEFDSVAEVDDFIKTAETAIAELTAECGTADKYTAEAVVDMIGEIDRLTADQTLAVARRDYLIKWAEKESEYYYAAKVWQRFIAEGYSPEATAGILGSLMWETAGGTLALDPCIYDADRWYYGMCMWSLYYTPQIADATFEEQLEHLVTTMEPEFDTFGFCYRRGFTFEDFKQMTNPREAALAFAKVYERCADFSYGVRKSAAERALEYFTADV